jgi:hypothetical protein
MQLSIDAAPLLDPHSIGSSPSHLLLDPHSIGSMATHYRGFSFPLDVFPVLCYRLCRTYPCYRIDHDFSTWHVL